MLTFQIILLVIISFWIYIDYYTIEVDRLPITTKDHLYRAVIRGIMIAFACSFTRPEGWKELLTYWLLGATEFWILFDIGLNLSRKLPMFYLGENSLLDKTFKSFGQVLYFIFKLIILVGSILLIILL